MFYQLQAQAPVKNNPNILFNPVTATLLTSGMVSVRSGVFGWNKKDEPKLHW